nr:uncharacterized protein LOC108169832 [Malus domestica]
MVAVGGRGDGFFAVVGGEDGKYLQWWRRRMSIPWLEELTATRMEKVANVSIGGEEERASPMTAMTSLNFSNIETLTGSNYKKWKEDLEIALGMMDFDLALREDKPAALTVESTAEQKSKSAQWEKANRMALMIMRRSMTSSVKGGIPKSDSAKTFFDAIGNKFKESEKAETGNFLTKLTSMKFDGVGSVREHILKMSNIAQKLKELEHPLTDQFLVHMALNSLPAQKS